MDTERDRLSEIKGHEAWLREYASPLPSAEMLGGVRRAVRLELEATPVREALASTPTPSPEVISMVRRAIRRELARRFRRPARVWWPGAGLAWAACLALVAGLAWQTLNVASPGDLAAADRELEQFVESLDGVLGQSDVQIALLEQDIRDSERAMYLGDSSGTGPEESELDDLQKAIDGLGNEVPLWPDDVEGDEV
jgi:predicted nucleic acid-binding protein